MRPTVVIAIAAILWLLLDAIPTTVRTVHLLQGRQESTMEHAQTEVTAAANTVEDDMAVLNKFLGAVDDQVLLDAIWEVESGSRTSTHTPIPLGDGGLARGPYQIHRSFFLDAREALGEDYLRYEDAVEDIITARRLVRAYWGRYCPDEFAALSAGELDYRDLVILIATFHLGPSGRHLPAALADDAYRDRVLDAIINIVNK